MREREFGRVRPGAVCFQVKWNAAIETVLTAGLSAEHVHFFFSSGRSVLIDVIQFAFTFRPTTNSLEGPSAELRPNSLLSTRLIIDSLGTRLRSLPASSEVFVDQLTSLTPTSLLSFSRF